MPVKKRKQTTLQAFSILSQEETEPLQEVYERVAAGCRESLILAFSKKRLVINANADDDTITVSCEEPRKGAGQGYLPLKRHPLWSKFVGKQFGWGWEIVNQQGYHDGVLLSFGDEIFPPDVLLEVTGSSIRVHEIREATMGVVSGAEDAVCANAVGDGAASGDARGFRNSLTHKSSGR